jgi:hypothetical protein
MARMRGAIFMKLGRAAATRIHFRGDFEDPRVLFIFTSSDVFSVIAGSFRTPDEAPPLRFPAGFPPESNPHQPRPDK